MLTNFIYAETKELFLEQLNDGNIPDDAVVFIDDSKEIWNNGTFYGTVDFKLSTSSSRPIQNKVVAKEIQRIWTLISGESFNKDFNRDFAVNPV